VAYVYSWNVTEIDLLRLVTDFHKAVPIIADFLTPDLFARGESTRSYVIDYPVPCDSGEISEVPERGARIVVTPPVPNQRSVIVVEGFDLRPDTDVQLRWLLPDDRRLRSERTRTDTNGNFDSRS
jgi:hypothetical protein